MDFKVKKWLTFQNLFLLFMVTYMICASQDVFAGNIDRISGFRGEYKWPWTSFFAALAHELTGPLPMVLGIIAIAAAAFCLFAGHSGAGTQKFIVIIFAIGICLFAPTFINYIKSSASAATVSDVLEVLRL